jgi:hypothetical protein
MNRARLALGAHVVLSLIAASASFAASMVLPFTDDYDKALAEARSKRLPLFIEAWAPW